MERRGSKKPPPGMEAVTALTCEITIYFMRPTVAYGHLPDGETCAGSRYPAVSAALPESA